MALAALLKFTQGATVGPDGQALPIVTGGDPVNVGNSDNDQVASWRIELLYGPPGSSFERDPGDPLLWAENPNDSAPTKSFDPAVGYDGECYRIRLRVWDGANYTGTMDEDIRCVAPPMGSLNAVFPPNQIDPPTLTDKPNELNFGGQLYHWSGDTPAHSSGIRLVNPQLSAFVEHYDDTANPHATDLGNIGSGSLAELNAAVTDATLDDSGDPRDPNAHVTTHHSGGSDALVHDSIAGSGTNSHAQIDTHIADTANPHATDVGNLGSGSLAELNTAITDATLDDSGDPRDPNAHASTHLSGNSDEVDGDKLDIDWNPTNYTPTTSPSEVDSVDQLTAHLAGIDAELASVGPHASTHIEGAADEIDGDKLDIDWNPTNYTPSAAPTEVDSVDQLTAHLYGIDQALASGAFPGYDAGLPATSNAGVGSAGVDTTVNRSDHRHSVATGVPIDLAWGSSSAGTSTNLARADHQHAVTAQVTPTACSALAGQEGTATTFVRGDHRHQISTGVAATSLGIGDIADEGASNAIARATHVHGFPAYTGGVTTVSAATGTLGNAGQPARGNHSHTVAVTGVGLIKPGVTQLEGTSDSLARSDHLHACNVENPTVAVDAGPGTIGSAETFNRGDHKHQVTTSGTTPVSVLPTGNVGTSNALARSDHRHGIDLSAIAFWPLSIPILTSDPGNPSSGYFYLWADSINNRVRLRNAGGDTWDLTGYTS